MPDYVDYLNARKNNKKANIEPRNVKTLAEERVEVEQGGWQGHACSLAHLGTLGWAITKAGAFEGQVFKRINSAGRGAR